jgi:hypothetical protein
VRTRGTSADTLQSSRGSAAPERPAPCDLIQGRFWTTMAEA